MNATSATGSDISVPAIAVKMSRRVPCSRTARSVPSRSGDQNRRADDGNGQQHLKRRGGDVQNRDDGPVCRGQQRAALEQRLELHTSRTKSCTRSPLTAAHAEIVFLCELCGLCGELLALYAVSIVLKSSALCCIVGAGIVAALAVALGGRALERVRFGASDAEAMPASRAEVSAAIRCASADNLAAIAGRVASQPDSHSVRPRATPPAPPSCLTRWTPCSPKTRGGSGITVYDPAGTPLAWAGRVSEAPATLDEPATIVLTVGALGPRLVRIEPVMGPAGDAPCHAGSWSRFSIPTDQSPALGDRFELSTLLTPVSTLRVGAVTPTSVSRRVFHHVPGRWDVGRRRGGTRRLDPGTLAVASGNVGGDPRRPRRHVAACRRRPGGACGGARDSRGQISPPRPASSPALVLARTVIRLATREVETAPAAPGVRWICS